MAQSHLITNVTKSLSHLVTKTTDERINLKMVNHLVIDNIPGVAKKFVG